MSSPVDPPNYWPGFVDALVTVLLNLLFLVGIFAIGLVSLNLEIMAAQKKMAALEAQALLALKGGMILLPQGETSRQQPAPQPAPVTLAEGQPRIQELRIQGNSPQASESDGLGGAQAGAGGSQQAAALRAYVEKISGGLLVEQLGFEPQQFVWPSDRSLPALEIAASQRGMVFVILVDKNNLRLLREAFKRLSSVRAEYLRMGAAPEKLQIQIGASPPEASTVPGLNNTVWVLRRASNR